MKTYIIRRASIKKETGSLTGFTTKGERVHATKKTLETAGLPTDLFDKERRLKSGNVLYVIAQTEKYLTLAEDGSPRDPKTAEEDDWFTRLTATVVSTSKEEISEIMNEENLLEIEQAADLVAKKNEIFKARGLNEAQVAALVSAAAGI